MCKKMEIVLSDFCSEIVEFTLSLVGKFWPLMKGIF